MSKSNPSNADVMASFAALTARLDAQDAANADAIATTPAAVGKTGVMPSMGGITAAVAQGVQGVDVTGNEITVKLAYDPAIGKPKASKLSDKGKYVPPKFIRVYERLEVVVNGHTLQGQIMLWESQE